jgi:hypothetical protein
MNNISSFKTNIIHLSIIIFITLITFANVTLITIKHFFKSQIITFIFRQYNSLRSDYDSQISMSITASPYKSPPRVIKKSAKNESNNLSFEEMLDSY